MHRRLLTLLSIVTVALRAPAQGAPDDPLVSVKFSKATDSTTLSANVDLIRTDTLTDSTLVKLAMPPLFSLRVEYPGEGPPGTSSSVGFALGYFYSYPPLKGEGLAYSADGGIHVHLPANWACVRSPPGDVANAFIAPMSHQRLRMLASAGKLDFYVGDERFSVTEAGMAALRAFAAKVPVPPGGDSADAELVSMPPPAMWMFQVDRPAVVSEWVAPQYPRSEQAQHKDGDVMLQFVVDSGGHVLVPTIKVLKSTSTAFSDAARLAVVHWRFRPAQACGRAVDQYVQAPFVFQAP